MNPVMTWLWLQMEPALQQRRSSQDLSRPVPLLPVLDSTPGADSPAQALSRPVALPTGDEGSSAAEPEAQTGEF